MSGGLTVGAAGTGVTVMGVLMAVAGLALAVVGVLGWCRRLPRNRFAGVRTAATLRDEETFAVGNHVSAPLTVTAAAVAVVAGAASVFAPSPLTGWVVAGLGLLGMATLTLVGGVLGDRAARLAAPMESLGGCTGVCTGCSLVEGCSGAGSEPAAASEPGAGGTRAAERSDAPSS